MVVMNNGISESSASKAINILTQKGIIRRVSKVEKENL